LNQLTIHWGVQPFPLKFEDDPSLNVDNAIALLKERGLLKTGDNIVAVTEVEVRGRMIDTILRETVD
jgi:pyruvate kinase